MPSPRFDKLESAAKGRLGCDIITDTTVHNGKWGSITVIADAVFTTLTEADVTGSLGGNTVKAGITLVGYFTVITLASGVVRAYRAE